MPLNASQCLVFGRVCRRCVRRWTTWNAGEVAFAVITWCPKATVQAALAGVALDYIEITGEDYGSGAEYEAEMGE
eukprot:2218758-Prymnesium_polylepis.1